MNKENGFITRKMLADAGGLVYEIVEPKSLDITDCKKRLTWPNGLPEPEVIVFNGTRVYAKTARELAKELGTTPRQVSKLRSGQIKEAKPLSWYKENRKSCSNSKRTSGRRRSFTPVHLPTGI